MAYNIQGVRMSTTVEGSGFNPVSDWETASVTKQLSSRLTATVYKDKEGHWHWKVECLSCDGEYFLYERSTNKGLTYATTCDYAKEDVLNWYRNHLKTDAQLFDMSSDEIYKTALTAFEDLKKAPASAIAFHEKFKGHSNKLAGLVAEHGINSDEVDEYLTSMKNSEFHGPLHKIAQFMGYNAVAPEKAS